MNKINAIFRLTLLIALFSATYTQAGMDKKSIKERLAPVGQVCLEGENCGSAVAAAEAGPKTPADIYQASCFACHGTGAAGAPKMGDVPEWETRLAKGIDTVIANAINGINGMPAMGTCASCSEDDIAETVRYMVENSK